MDKANGYSMDVSVDSFHKQYTAPRLNHNSPERARPRFETTQTLRLDMPGDMFGYIAPPGTITPHRDVLRWVQSLDLAHSLKDCRRDLANGFFVAQIFSRYFPDKVPMHSFENGISTATKKDNWWQIQKFCKKWRGEPLPEQLVEDTMNRVHAAGVLLLHLLYETFTGKKVPERPPSPEPDDADEEVEEPKRRVIKPITKKGRPPPTSAQTEDPSVPAEKVPYGIMGSKPVTRTREVSKSGVEFGKSGKIQLGQVSDVQELCRKLQGL